MERWQYEFDSMLALGEPKYKNFRKYDPLSVTAFIDDYVEDFGDLPTSQDVRLELDIPEEHMDQVEAELRCYERDDSRWQKS